MRRSALVTIVAVLGVMATRCDDAILGERPLACDGGCSDAAGPTPPSIDAPSCVEVAVPKCDAGVPTARRDERGCVVDYACVLACSGVGGTCGSRGDCTSAGGRLADDVLFDCASDGTRTCCLPACPPVSAPPADWCDAGTTATPVRDASGCVTGFACL